MATFQVEGTYLHGPYSHVSQHFIELESESLDNGELLHTKISRDIEHHQIEPNPANAAHHC